MFRYAQLFLSSILLCTVPVASLYPQSSTTITYTPLKLYNLTYDEYLQLFADIESGELEKRCNEDDLKRLIDFLVHIGRLGLLPGDEEEALKLERDIQDLLSDEEETFYFWNQHYNDYVIAYRDQGELVLCKSWYKKVWKKVKKYVEEHKTAVIVGAVLVVTGLVIVGVVEATAAAATTAAIDAATSDSDHHKKDKSTEPVIDIPPMMTMMEDSISSFKENLAGKFIPSSQEVSLEENGRILGSLFAHDSINHVTAYSGLSLEQYTHAQDIGHLEVDHIFSTNYATLANPDTGIDFNILPYQLRGERALATGYYNQAIQDFGKAIELEPFSPIPYLQRGIAHFQLGNYDRSIQDYQQFAVQTQTAQPLSIADFSLGFAGGLPQGIYDSGHGLFLLASNLITHPVQTCSQMWEALTFLSHLACSGDWSALSEAVAPEVFQLAKEWNDLPSELRGERAGYVFGKYGADIIIPVGLTKVVSKGVKGAQELSAAYRKLKITEQTFLLESVTGLEYGAKIAEFVQLEKQISEWLGEGTRLIRNEVGDPIFLSKDGLRRVRFDFNRPYPHKNPHVHIEYKVGTNWEDSAGQIYPIDVPHN